MAESGQMTLFNEIASCLMGMTAPSEVREGWIKKDRVLAFWEACYLSFDRDNLYITRKQKQIIPLNSVRTSSTVRLKSKRYCFTLEMLNSRYYLGFATEEAAVDTLRALTETKQQSQQEPQVSLPEPPSPQAS